MRVTCVLIGIVALAGSASCGDNDDGPACDFDLSFAEGDDGHPDPLAVGPGEARAGRLEASEIPPSTTGLAVWEAGDFVLANEKIALVIEDVGLSDLYDPWGGKPVGLARMSGGGMIEPGEFGEFFLFTGRYSLLATSVSVLADGSDGGAAVVRAAGLLRPTPFIETLAGALLRDEYDDIPTAIDYVLEPGADQVDIYIVHHSPRTVDAEVPTGFHGFMYAERTPTFAPGFGFDTESKRVPYMAFIDDDATSWAYRHPTETLGSGISASGFVSNFTDGVTIAACSETVRHHAQLIIGGPGLDELRQAIARVTGDELRAVTGVVRDAGGAPAAGVRVHVEDADGNYITRALSGVDGSYAVHVPTGQGVKLTAWRRGDEVVGPIDVGAGESGADITLGETGTIRVTIDDADLGGALPARVQILPAEGSAPSVPGHFGERRQVGGRLHVAYPMNGEVELPAPVGDWRVVVSRGYEYELHDEQVTVTAGGTAEVNASLSRVVDTTGVMCADYHIHTFRSNDSGDPDTEKVASAVADGLEIPIRSEHEYAAGFAPQVASLGVEDWAFGMSSVELTTMETYGHFGVLPIEPVAGEVNGGTPLWQSYPTPDDPDLPLVTLEPTELFARVRARPEQPVIIINHPRGGANYFDAVGIDRISGLPQFPTLWDEEFRIVEVFNSASWTQTFDRTVADWLTFLDNGRKVFAVGSSDSHTIASSPVGYPRTCLELGTDDPRALTPSMVRDATAAGHSNIYGGVYVDARIGNAGPGDEVTGAGSTATVDVTIQAPSWVSVDWLEVVVDGEVVDTIAVMPQDADQDNPVIRWAGSIDLQVAPGAGSYVIIAAYGDGTLAPVHPGRQPFGVTNPIFLVP